jgi:hypothetical protein
VEEQPTVTRVGRVAHRNFLRKQRSRPTPRCRWTSIRRLMTSRGRRSYVSSRPSPAHSSGTRASPYGIPRCGAPRHSHRIPTPTTTASRPPATREERGRGCREEGAGHERREQAADAGRREAAFRERRPGVQGTREEEVRIWRKMGGDLVLLCGKGRG